LKFGAHFWQILGEFRARMSAPAPALPAHASAWACYDAQVKA